jgi:hypothetical protein
MFLAALPKPSLKSSNDKGFGSGSCYRLPRDGWVESHQGLHLHRGHQAVAIAFPEIGGLKVTERGCGRSGAMVAIAFPEMGGLKDQF